MKKLKLLLAACALMVWGAGSANADDVFKDVTATYLTNADFEGTYSVYTNPKNDRAIYQPDGWTVTYQSGKEWDMTVLASGDLCYSSFSSVPSLSTGGNKTYRIRFNNSYKDQRLELSQTPNLLKGTYKLSVDWYISRTDAGDGYIWIGNDRTNASVSGSWQIFSKVFTSSGEATTIKLGAYHSAKTEKFYAFDNFKLEWNLTKSLTDLLTEANTFYETEGNTYTALKSAIDNADAVKESTDADVLETQYNALSAAFTLAQHRKGWLDAWTTANTNYTSDTYANIKGSEKTALKTEIDKTEPTTADDYDSAKTELETANTTFTGAKANYDALANVNALITSAGTLSYADSEKKPSGEVSATSAEDADTKTASQYTALRAYFESHALAEGVATTMNFTSRLTNYVNPSNTTGWTINNTTGNSKMRTQSNQPYTNSDGTVATGYFDSDSWNAAFTTTFTQNVTLPAGTYLLTVKARGNNVTTFKVVANDTKADITEHGNTGGVFGKGWDDYSVEFTLTAAGPVTLGVEMETGNSSNWLSFGDFRLMKLDATYADNDDYTALNAAISTAEGKTLGFQTGEYAPYNNIEALALLAAAKAIDQDAENIQSDVQTAATALAEATWTANESEVNAIWDGSFENDYSGMEGNVQPYGWYRNEGTYSGDGTNVRYVKLPTGVTGNTSVHGLFGKFTLMYGAQPGYTLPLNEGYYTLKFTYGGWNEQGTREVKLYNDDNNAAIQTSTIKAKNNQAHANADAYSEYSSLISVPADGDYTLSFYRENTSSQNQIVITDIVLKTATQEEVVAYFSSIYNANKEAAEAARDNDTYVNVTGNERTALVNAINDDTFEKTYAGYNTAAENLATATAAFTAAKDSYDVWATAKSANYDDDQPYASADKYTAIATAQAATPTTAADAATAAAAVTSAYRKYVESNALAEGVEGATSITIQDPNMEVTYNSTSHTFGAWQVFGQVDGNIQLLSNESFTDGDGKNDYKYADIWKSDNNAGIKQTISDLPAGKYLLTVTARANTTNDATFYVFAGSTTAPIQRISNSGGVFDRGWNDASVEFEVTKRGDVEIGVQSGNGKDLWWSATRFRLVRLETTPIAETSDYSALKDAISDAEGYALGFDEGQYAPYNNVTALQALADAQAIKQDEENSKSKVNELTATLNGATWTANTEEVNAIHNGNFATAENLGWNFSAWGEFVSGLNTNTNASNGTARSSNAGKLTYGNTAGYTMPLKANSYYRLNFKVSSWDNDNKNTGTDVSVLNSASEGLTTKNFDASGTNRDQYGAFKTYTTIFKTGEAGDYTLVITAKGGRSVYTDIVLIKAVEAVTVTAAGYATYVSEYDLDFTDTNIKAYTAKVSSGKVVLTQIEKVPAGTPVVLYCEGGVTEGVPLATSTDTAEDNDLLAGTGAAVATTDGDYTNYILNNVNNEIGFYKANGKTVAANRAYLHVSNSEIPTTARLTIVFEDATGITSLVNSDGVNSEKIYNLNGQRVTTPKRGLYIVDGKKVLKK